MIDNSMDSYQSRESDNDNNDRLKRGIQQDLSPNGHSISYGNGAIINDNSIDNATNYNSHTQITPNHDMLSALLDYRGKATGFDVDLYHVVTIHKSQSIF